MSFSLAGRTAIISGAYGGIGYAIANRFAQEGTKLVLLGRSESKLRAASEKLRVGYQDILPHPESSSLNVTTLTCDVAHHEDWQRVAASCSDVDILVNCAGVTQESILFKTDIDTAKNILDTNLQGAIWGCKFIGKQMIKDRKRACIINVSSLLATKAVVGTSIYAASKAGLLGLTTSLAGEYGRFGIRVNAILPGYISTAMTRSLSDQEVRDRVPLGRFGTVDEVADAAVFLAQNGYANNCVLNIDGGLSAT